MRPIACLGVLSMLCLSACATHFQRVRDNTVTLVLRRPDAGSVMLATSLDGFDQRPAVRVGDGWEVTLPADKGFRYFYAVDGKIEVPDCPLSEKDDFGYANCIFEPRP